MHHYVEALRNEANHEIFDFFEGVDASTDSKNLKLLYFYFVGSRNLLLEMNNEALQHYLQDQMQPMRNDLRKAMTGMNRKNLGYGKRK